MKIALLIQRLDIRGGTHKQVLRLCEYLIRNGEDVIIYTLKYVPSKTYPEFKKLAVRSIDNQENGIFDGGFIPQIKLFRIIPKDIDIIHIHDNGLFYTNLMCLSNRRTVIIWQINDLPRSFRCGISSKKNDTFWFVIQRFLYKFLIRSIDDVTVNVTKNQERIEKETSVKAKVFYCGVDINYNLMHHKKIQDKAHINLLTTGVFYPYRNYETIVRAVYELKKENYNVFLNIVGKYDTSIQYEKEIRSIINDFGLYDRVKILGQLDEKEFDNVYNDSDIFLFVNVDQSWGLAAFEAMSCGLPVVLSRSVGAVELLKNDSCLIVDPLDVNEIVNAIKILINDEKRYTLMSELGIESMKDYSWDKMYSSNVYSLYKKDLELKKNRKQ